MLKNIILLIYIIWIKIKAFFYFKKESRRIVIIKTDAIGDYILFRNFLNEIASDSQYQDCKITLVCNTVIKDLVTELDGQIIDNFIFVNHKATTKQWFTTLSELARFKFYVAINYHYSRNLINELMTFTVSAGNKITMDGDYMQIRPSLKPIINSLYSSLISIPGDIENEFEINKFFAEKIVSRKLKYTHPQISVTTPDKYQQFAYTHASIVIAPGAGASYRRFETSLLIELVSVLSDNYKICFIGPAADGLIVDVVKKNLPGEKLDKLIDLTGKTDLKHLPGILYNSFCVIGNDSGIYHMAVALNKPVLCITGGGHFKRFVAYKERANIKVCYNLMPCYNCDWNCIYKVDSGTVYPCISSINASDVLMNFRLLEKIEAIK